jgi:HNH endonuclease
LLTRLHRIRERSRKLVEHRKQKALAEFGRLCCEVCRFDFEKSYGEGRRGFIEAHHTKPVETLVEGSKTRLEDLALLCANCHRMAHSQHEKLKQQCGSLSLHLLIGKDDAAAHLESTRAIGNCATCIRDQYDVWNSIGIFSMLADVAGRQQNGF